MEESTPPPVLDPSPIPPPVPVAAPAPKLDRAAIVQANPEILNGAGWFWWIAGLSLLNTILIHSGSETSLAIGLGFTLMADAIFKDMKVVAFIIDALALATIVGLGFGAKKGYVWAFVVGIVLYGLDALIYVGLQGWMGVGIHCVALLAPGPNGRSTRVHTAQYAMPAASQHNPGCRPIASRARTGSRRRRSHSLSTAAPMPRANRSKFIGSQSRRVS